MDDVVLCVEVVETEGLALRFYLHVFFIHKPQAEPLSRRFCCVDANAEESIHKRPPRVLASSLCCPAASKRNREAAVQILGYKRELEFLPLLAVWFDTLLIV